MYAVIETGGKQYRVELGSELAVERLDVAPGATIDFDRVLLVAHGDTAQIGTPTVADAVVTADVLRQDRGAKVVVFKYRPKARHRAKKGHRQEQTVLRITDIRFNGRSAADEAGKERTVKVEAREQAQAEAERKAAADQALAAKLAADAAAAAEPAAETKASATKTTRRTAATKAAAEQEPAAPAKPSTAKPPAKTTRSSTKAAPKAVEPTASTEAKPRTTRARTTRSSTKKDE